jgi:DNA-binding transcriptional ArsR family regulator
MQNLDLTFAALADPTRRAILAQLAQGEATVGELAAPFAISLPAVSRHLKVLEDASLIVRRREGQTRRCSLDPRPLSDAAEWLGFYRRFWGASLDRLAAHLDSDKRKPAHGKRGQSKRARR